MKNNIIVTVLLTLVSTVLSAQTQQNPEFEANLSGGGPGWMLGAVGGAMPSTAL